jgi:alkanesulfonate monooxygenase SsuD/methylene tetrahydromethanopterin reductase-like flavin-dependent oxidoreductase (luciferase family)
MASLPVPAIAVALSHVEPQVGPHLERLLELARAVEEGGVDQIVLSEHVLLAEVISGHPGAASTFPFPGTEQYPEPLVTLAAIAAVTTRARLSTNILIAPLRPAALLAKMMATLDCLSGGRLEIGVGTGWHQPEYAAMGVPMEKLPQRLDDTLRACRALWRDQPASFTS